MKKEYVSFEQAQALKECGFDWECDRYYERQKGFGLRESSIFSQTFDVSDYWHNFNAYDPNRHRQPGNPFYSAPSLALAQKWLREVKGWHIEVRINGTRKMFCVEIWEMTANGYFMRLEHNDGHVRLFDSYESALSTGLDAALELIKQNRR